MRYSHKNTGRVVRTAPAAQQGFTIIELMIATVVFSLVLLIVTTGVLQFSRQYYKGIISSTTQGTARALIDDVTRAIQFNGGGVTSPTNTHCVGFSKRYSFALNRQVVDVSPSPADHQSRHALVSDTIPGCDSAAALSVTNSGLDLTALTDARELLGPRMRLSKFDVTPGPDYVYTVTVRVAYGDDDLLCNPTFSPTDCSFIGTSPSVNNAAASRDLICKVTTGSQYCATSELTTTVKKRVAP